MGAEAEEQRVHDSSGGPHWWQNGKVRQSGWSNLPRHLSTASKIWAAFICAVVGLVFFFVGSMVRTSGNALDGGTTVEGIVIATPSSDSGETCGKRVRYYVDGVPYEAGSSMSSSSACGRTGGTAKVSYLPSSPGSGRVIDDGSGWFGLLFQALGGGLVVYAVYMVVSAIRSLTSDRSDVVAGSVPSQMAPNLSDLKFTGPPPGPPGPAQPPPLPPPAVAPPPGWYLDPDGPDGSGEPSRQRWWDGRVWTDHRR